MKLVGDFLSRFQNLTPPNDSLKQAISETVKTTLNIQCPKENISISNGVAYLKISSVAKNTIRVNRGRVLEYLFERLPKARDTIRDVR